MKTKRIFIISLLTVFLSACGAFPSASDPLDGTSWELVAIAEQPPLEGTTVTLSFEDGLASGTSGCNSYGGPYRANGDEIDFQEFEATLMACLDTGVMEQETVYLRTLGEAERFELTNGQLQIYGSDGEALTYIPVE